MSRRADRCVCVRAPARLHMGFVDLHGGLGRRFGSLGLALERPFTEVSLSTAGRVSAAGPDAARATRYATMLAEHFDLASGTRIEVQQAIPPHAGLGSGTQLALSVGVGMARLFDLDAESLEIASVLGRGARSGLGLGLFEQGGFVVDGGSAGGYGPPPIITRLPFPAGWRLMLVFDRTREGVHGEAEREAFATLPRFPEADAAELCRLVLMQVLPGLVEGDLEAVGPALTRIQARVGDHFASAQGGRFASPGVTRVLDWLRSCGIEGFGQSSWGPTGFALCPDEETAMRLMAKAKRRFADEIALDFVVTRGRNEGASIRSESLVH